MWRPLLLIQASWMTIRGDAARRAGNYAEAERLLHQAVSLSNEAGERDDRLDAELWNALGVLYKYQARFSEGARAYLRALPAARRRHGRKSAAVATLYHNVGGLEHSRGRFRRAEPFARRAVELREASLGPDHPDVARDIAALGGVLDGLGRHAEAEALHRRAIAVFQRTLGPKDVEIAYTEANLRGVLHLQGRTGGGGAHRDRLDRAAGTAPRPRSSRGGAGQGQSRGPARGIGRPARPPRPLIPSAPPRAVCSPPTSVPEGTTDPRFENTAALITRVKSGDSVAREQLVARYLPLLERWAHGRLPSHARGLLETGDLVQVTLVRALNHLESFERAARASLAYLRTTLMNQLRNEIRRSVRDPEQGVNDEHADERSPLLEQMIGREVIESYEAGLATLPERMQEAVILSVEFGLSHGEVAEAIGSPSANAARMLISRALVKLSAAMERAE
ncbi:MAG: sigma-70 family RNA polymerase sigma factor [Candidatus Eisenbacteria bacterium]